MLAGKMHFRHRNRQAGTAMLLQSDTFYNETNNLMHRIECWIYKAQMIGCVIATLQCCSFFLLSQRCWVYFQRAPGDIAHLLFCWLVREPKHVICIAVNYMEIRQCFVCTKIHSAICCGSLFSLFHRGCQLRGWSVSGPGHMHVHTSKRMWR